VALPRRTLLYGDTKSTVGASVTARGSGWLAFGLSVAAVAGWSAIGAVTFTHVGHATAVRAVPGPSYPRRPGSLPPWTSEVKDSPTGRAVAILETGDECAVYSADSSRVRLLSFMPASDADCPVLLSPDGTRYAVAHKSTVRVVDLRTGRSTAYPMTSVASGDSVHPDVLAWSPDGRQLVVAIDDVVLLDLAEHRVKRVHDPASTIIRASPDDPVVDPDFERLSPDDAPFSWVGPSGIVAAYAPDGKSLAVDDGDSIVIHPVGVPGAARELGAGRVRLAGSAAWTPDGTGLLVAQSDGELGEDLLRMDPRPGAGPEMTAVASFDADTFYDPRVVGWTGPDEYLVSGNDNDWNFLVRARPLNSAHDARTMMNLGTDTASVQLASGLLGTAVPRPAGLANETGPVPAPLVAGSAAGAGLAAIVVTTLLALLATTGRRRTSAAAAPAVRRLRTSRDKGTPPAGWPHGYGMHGMPGPVHYPEDPGPVTDQPSGWVQPP
jgi:hypothetical protein